MECDWEDCKNNFQNVQIRSPRTTKKAKFFEEAVEDQAEETEHTKEAAFTQAAEDKLSIKSRDSAESLINQYEVIKNGRLPLLRLILSYPLSHRRNLEAICIFASATSE